MAPRVKVGLNIVWAQPQHVVAFAQAAEELGYESVWSGEHVSLPATDDWWRSFPLADVLGDAFTADMVPFEPTSPFLDPMIVLAHVAAATERVRLGIGIYMLTLRDAVLVGRTLATLDVLSGGRLDMATGLGWTADEYRFTGNDWSVRGKRCNELIRALRVLFESPAPEFHGDFFDFGPLGFEPKPLQRPLPIHIGGGGPPALRRAAQLGDGWYGETHVIPEIERLRAEAGRADLPFEYSTISLGTVSNEELAALAEQGVHRVVVTPWPGRRVGEVGLEGLADIERYANEVGLST
ncbi:MAG TPA: TIGR03619 family F420-dependent LLM class oxidoreductase [Acidimicrobiales bacterium]|jgi:probable F420-dependent oxidoreductase|nr:TIGR03619 family F420-dependent LLM class oxidoreductase [Acidimicrobiales bacterium]